ncbi:hypothetical protein BLNAU_23114 [Blattamonas nauphoetae]|uniref:Uncharacterized protein n=1 Tax=Blattamonas nauphoetae TaxID=2049346 RepID=A0ABQ9WR32_9EUKA|nr:hypothetical protein BLNAU_23114 [Blattamonas nauphoetae]
MTSLTNSHILPCPPVPNRRFSSTVGRREMSPLQSSLETIYSQQFSQHDEAIIPFSIGPIPLSSTVPYSQPLKTGHSPQRKSVSPNPGTSRKMASPHPSFTVTSPPVFREPPLPSPNGSHPHRIKRPKTSVSQLSGVEMGKMRSASPSSGSKASPNPRDRPITLSLATQQFLIDCERDTRHLAKPAKRNAAKPAPLVISPVSSDWPERDRPSYPFPSPPAFRQTHNWSQNQPLQMPILASPQQSSTSSASPASDSSSSRKAHRLVSRREGRTKPVVSRSPSSPLLVPQLSPYFNLLNMRTLSETSRAGGTQKYRKRSPEKKEATITSSNFFGTGQLSDDCEEELNLTLELRKHAKSFHLTLAHQRVLFFVEGTLVKLRSNQSEDKHAPLARYRLTVDSCDATPTKRDMHPRRNTPPRTPDCPFRKDDVIVLDIGNHSAVMKHGAHAAFVLFPS